MMEMIPLDYNFNEFKFLSEENLKNHYDILYNGYVNNYNKVLKELEKARSENNFENIKALEKNLAFQGAGAVLHELFFENITPQNQQPKGNVLGRIKKDFGSLEIFRNQFISNITNIEGSGWGLLGYSKSQDRLIILQAEKHQDQTIWDFIPLLVIDIWEHAYYLDYITDKKTYAENIFDSINWEIVEKRYNNL